MTESGLEALFYDWNNAHRLRRQRADERFWRDVCGPRSAIVVCGAGTGRVAHSLCEPSSSALGDRSVVAVDIDRNRLKRVPRHERLYPVAGDMTRLPLRSASVDVVVVPYSAFQLITDRIRRRTALTEMARCVRTTGEIWIDVSSRFEERRAEDWHVVLTAPVDELGYDVCLWERTTVRTDRIELRKQFTRRDGGLLLDVREQWMFERSLHITDEAAGAGLVHRSVVAGYGGPDTRHRRIHVLRPSG